MSRADAEAVSPYADRKHNLIDSKSRRYAITSAIALRPDDAAALLGISKSTLAKLVAEGKFRGPTAIRNGIVLYDANWLQEDWEALRDEFSRGSANSWDDA